MEPERITARQIEAARRAITRHIKRQGRLWIRIFPDVPVSSKPAEVRMGSGKGSPEFWVARVKPGRILFELDGVPGPLAKAAFERAAEKLPIKTKVVARLGETLARGGRKMAADRRSQGQDRRPAAEQLVELKREQFNLRFQAATNQLEKPARVREVRRTIARIKTLQSERAARRQRRRRKEIRRCPSASSPAPWCPTRPTRPWWSASSGG